MSRHSESFTREISELDAVKGPDLGFRGAEGSVGEQQVACPLWMPYTFKTNGDA